MTEEQLVILRTLIERNQLHDAFRELYSLYEHDPEDTTTARLLRHVSRKLGMLELAISLGRILVAKFPTAEADSVELFHALLYSGEIGDAFSELNRLTKLGHSPEYGRILAELRRKLSLEPNLSHANQVLLTYCDISEPIYQKRSENPPNKLTELMEDIPISDKRH